MPQLMQAGWTNQNFFLYFFIIDVFITCYSILVLI